MSMTVKGRGYAQPYWRITPTSDGINIRIDDESNCESWMEITIPEYLLSEFLRQCALLVSGCSGVMLGGNPKVTNRGPLKLDGKN